MLTVSSRGEGGSKHIRRLASLRREQQSVKSLRAVRDGVCGAERRSTGGGGAAQVNPIAQTQVGIVLQLIHPSGLSAPTQTKPAVGQRQRLELRHHGRPENVPGTDCAAVRSRAIETAVTALGQHRRANAN